MFTLLCSAGNYPYDTSGTHLRKVMLYSTNHNITSKKVLQALAVWIFYFVSYIGMMLDIYSPHFNNRNVNKLNIETKLLNIKNSSVTIIYKCQCAKHHLNTVKLLLKFLVTKRSDVQRNTKLPECEWHNKIFILKYRNRYPFLNLSEI